MLKATTTYVIETDGFKREITITPLFFTNHDQPWQPNEIFELTQQGTWLDGETEI